jgi:hypothetical protein
VTRPGWIKVLTDINTYVWGWVIILKQAGIFFAPPSQVNETFIWLGVALISGTGLAQLVGTRFGTALSGVQPPSPAPSAQSSSAPDDKGGKP